jgi:hypothetical protein
MNAWMVGVEVIGVFSPQPPNNRWGGLLSMGAPDSPVRHRTLSGAPATSSNCYGLTVEALSSSGTGQSGAAPDRYCSMSGAPLVAALTYTRTIRAL